VSGTQDGLGAPFATKCRIAVLCTNRRLGVPRKLDFKGEDTFAGQIRRGLGSDAESLDWAHKTIIIGMGAYALEHMRTAIERGAPYCSILCRQRGTVCPQSIDWVNFVRPVEDNFLKNGGGSAIIHEAWENSYKESGAIIPNCWSFKPLMLKPDGHTVSTSDLFFVAHYLKMAETIVGEIAEVKPKGIHTIASGEKPDTFLECGVLIKCVGFHINAANEKILGEERKQFRAIGLIDENLWCQLEAHLDAGFFNLPFGSSYLSAVNFCAQLVSKGWNEPESMAKLLSTPVNANVTTFTTADIFDSIQAAQKVLPAVYDILHKQVVDVRDRFNKALSFKEYLDRNEIQWDECHRLLYGRTPVANARRKPQLKWRFRPFEKMVKDEWDRYFAKQEAKKQMAAVEIS